MAVYETLIANVEIVDGGGGEPRLGSVAIADGRIQKIAAKVEALAEQVIDGKGKVLAPGFIDSHTHDDLYAIRSPEMLPKLSQGVTTVIAGNCGISAAPVTLKGGPPEPLNLLGEAAAFRYPTFASYVAAIEAARPAVNLAALVGHTALRNNHMDRLDRAADASEIAAMRMQLREALDNGALGLSTGLAYENAIHTSEDEVNGLAEALQQPGAIYATHLRSEGKQVIDAMQEAFRTGRQAQAPVVISHLKCTGIDNWHRSQEILQTLEAQNDRALAWDCYPYAATSTVLDPRQVDERVTVMVAWSAPHPEQAGRTIAEIAKGWGVTQAEAASRLRPAGAIYHSLSEEDVRTILQHPNTMIGSDGLPNDRFPHPRLWGTFPRVLGHYCREQRLFSLFEAVRKMTSLPAARFGLGDRGWIRQGYAADLVLFDPEAVQDTATFADPIKPARGIEAVWVNGVLSYSGQKATGQRAGRFLRRQPKS